MSLLSVIKYNAIYTLYYVMKTSMYTMSAEKA